MSRPSENLDALAAAHARHVRILIRVDVVCLAFALVMGLEPLVVAGLAVSLLGLIEWGCSFYFATQADRARQVGL